MLLPSGPAAHVHPGDAALLDGQEQARLGQAILPAGLVARRRAVGKRA